MYKESERRVTNWLKDIQKSGATLRHEDASILALNETKAKQRQPKMSYISVKGMRNRKMMMMKQEVPNERI